jgi:hypothetical protein
MKQTTSEGRRLRPLLDQQRSAWRILNLFTNTPKDERAFRATFEALDPEDRVWLRSFYLLPSERDVFERICAFWNVRLDNEEKEN